MSSKAEKTQREHHRGKVVGSEESSEPLQGGGENDKGCSIGRWLVGPVDVDVGDVVRNGRWERGQGVEMIDDGHTRIDDVRIDVGRANGWEQGIGEADEQGRGNDETRSNAAREVAQREKVAEQKEGED